MSSLIDIYVNTVVVYMRLFTLLQMYVYFHAMKIVTETDKFYSTKFRPQKGGGLWKRFCTGYQ